MTRLLTSVAVLAALYSPANAGALDLNEDGVVGINMAMTYDANCRPGALSQDTIQVLRLFLNRVSSDMRGRAETKVRGWYEDYGNEIFCRMARKIVEPKLNGINADASRLMNVLR
jgi:hypothetical protein